MVTTPSIWDVPNTVIKCRMKRTHNSFKWINALSFSTTDFEVFRRAPQPQTLDYFCKKRALLTQVTVTNLFFFLLSFSQFCFAGVSAFIYSILCPQQNTSWVSNFSMSSFKNSAIKNPAKQCVLWQMVSRDSPLQWPGFQLQHPPSCAVCKRWQSLEREVLNFPRESDYTNFIFQISGFLSGI